MAKSRVFDIRSGAVVIGGWIFAAIAIPSLPAQVPIHFDLSGKPNGTGPAAFLWIMPAALTVFYACLIGVRFIPARFRSYPVKLTDANRARVYALSDEMLPIISACAILTMLGVEWGSIDGAAHGSLGTAYFFVVFAPVALIVAVFIAYTIKMRAA